MHPSDDPTQQCPQVAAPSASQSHPRRRRRRLAVAFLGILGVLGALVIAVRIYLGSAGAAQEAAAALEARRSRLPVYLTGILVSSVILLIEDLDRPNTGFITVSQQPMVDTAAGIAAYADR